MKRIITLLALAIACIARAAAQDTAEAVSVGVPPAPNAPQSVPLMTPQALQFYARGLVDTMGGGVTGVGISGNTGFYIPYPKDPDPKHQSSATAGQIVNFTVGATNELTAYLYRNGTVNTACGAIPFELFHGDTNFVLTKVGTNYVIPTNAQTIKMVMDDYIPLYFPGMVDAHMELRDANGNVIKYYYFRNDGRLYSDCQVILVGQKHTAQRGELVVDLSNGTQLRYTLGDGKLEPTVSVVASGFTGMINGDRYLPDNTTNIVFQPGDQVLRVAFTSDSIVTVTLPAGLPPEQYPLAVYEIGTTALAQGQAADPFFNDWPYLNPFTPPMRFAAKVGATLIRFEFTPHPDPLDDNGYAKGAPVRNTSEP